MTGKSQLSRRFGLCLAIAVCALPSLWEGFVIAVGIARGGSGKALRDGLDFWAGGFLYLHGQLSVLLNHGAYQALLQGLYGALPFHAWSYPPTYGLLAAAFGWLPPWGAALAFDAASVLLLVSVLRHAGKGWGFIAALLASPASLESLLAHQNAALMTALLGGGLLLLGKNRRLAGVLIGLATIKPQLGLALPLFLLRRSPGAFAWAALAAAVLGGASFWAFGAVAWDGFLHVTGPAMAKVLLTGQPVDFYHGLVSTFAAMRPAGLETAITVQAAVTALAVLAGLFTRSVPALLVLSALASPYLHDYDLLISALSVALLVEDRLQTGFAPGETLLFFLAWLAPGLVIWVPWVAFAVPVLLLLLLASAWRRGGVPACDSSLVLPGSPA